MGVEVVEAVVQQSRLLQPLDLAEFLQRYKDVVYIYLFDALLVLDLRLNLFRLQKMRLAISRL